MRNFVLLCIMMFLQFFIWGAWYVTAPNFLTTIGFDANDIGWTYAAGPVAGIIAPLFVGMVADRFMAAQKVLGFMHLLGGGLMYYATMQMENGATPDAINIIFFVYMVTYFPTLALSNTVAMKNMNDSEKDFPKIRVFGTLGWIAAAFALTFLDYETNINMFYMTCVAALSLGVISFILPNTPANSDSEATLRQLLGLDALALLKDKAYMIFMVSSILICIPLAFYYQIASRVVEMAELPIAVTMSYGQWSEVIFMLCIPFFFARLGVKKMLAVGMGVWALRYALFAIGAPNQTSVLIVLGVLVHGICYDFFFVTGQIYTDKKAPEAIRAQAQGLLVMLTLGVGMFIGAKVAGYIEGYCTPETFVALERTVDMSDVDYEKASKLHELRQIDWQKLWGIPAVFAGAVLVFFIVAFKDDPTNESEHASNTSDYNPDADPYQTASQALDMETTEGEACSTDGDCDNGGG